MGFQISTNYKKIILIFILFHKSFILIYNRRKIQKRVKTNNKTKQKLRFIYYLF